MGLARTNWAIPNSLPAYYFEITLSRDETFQGSIDEQLQLDDSSYETEIQIEGQVSTLIKVTL